ncbi:cbb3-type cytochrome oxidase assembly protein CcoS [bacterium]|nr:cbb3-type cytochrome oxidase assembly protein CcoS [bacterium]
MKIIAILIGISLIMALVFLFAFYQALKSGQFEDLESPGFRLLDKKETDITKTNNNAKGKL